MHKTFRIKLYRGYGHPQNMVLYGHVFKWRASQKAKLLKNPIAHAWQILKAFMVIPLPYAKVRLCFHHQVVEKQVEKDGFFKFVWKPDKGVPYGINHAYVELLDKNNRVILREKGEILVSDANHYGCISDIDDTVLVSYSSTWFKRMGELLGKNPKKREVFADAAVWYQQLATVSSDQEQHRPFYYVSSSEWNLYDNLRAIFYIHQLPQGVYLLSHIKKLHQLFLTGKTKHEAKFRRITRIMRTFPEQQFILIGDNSQRDPIIYSAVADAHPNQIKAIFIRNIRQSKSQSTKILLKKVEEKNIPTCLFYDNSESIAFCKEMGLIVQEAF